MEPSALPTLVPTSFKFLEVINEAEDSLIFEIEYNGKPYALKVFHDDGVWENSATLNPSDSRFYREVKAYETLHKCGVCDRGFVPKYYGFIDQLDPSLDPFLEDFDHDKYHPGALLIEYLENPERLNCVNYSKERYAKAMESLHQIHSALVVHNDMYPRNILIVPGDPERVLVTDFDVAKTFSTQEDIDNEVGSYWPEVIMAVPFEISLLEGFGRKLEKDQKEGLRPNTSYY